MSDIVASTRCVICGELATSPPVRTGRSWFDRLPFLSWINSLQGMPSRYTIEHDAWAPAKYCSTCARNAVSKLEEEHASIRADHAAFNAAQQRKLSAIDHGGLDQMLRADFDRVLAQLNLAASGSQPQPKQLEATNVHVMPVASIGTERPE